ncbi:MAG TPA: hypothetical protein VGC30_00335 [Dokdonella sp.]
MPVNVVELPFRGLSDGELHIREWEAVMANGYGSPEHRRIEREREHRAHGAPLSRRPH